MTNFDFWIALAVVILTVAAAVIAVLWIAGCAWLAVLLMKGRGAGADMSCMALSVERHRAEAREAALAEQRAKIEALGKSGAVDPAAAEAIIKSVYQS